MSDLVACPFCRELFEKGEAKDCPTCGIALQRLDKLPPSEEAKALDPQAPEPVEPEQETLPFTYLGRGRGGLAGCALLGLAVFFAPWVHESAPEIRTLSGYEMARFLGWMWAPFVAWFVLLPLVLSRRTIHKMRGARFAVGFLAAIALSTVVLRMAFTPEPSPLRQVRFEWGIGLYATGFLAIAAMVLAAGFGGRVDDLPTQKLRRPGGETVH